MPVGHVPSSTPYPWPWDGDLTGSAMALMVVVPRGAAPQQEAGLVVAVQTLAASLRKIGGLVVLVTTRPPGYRTSDDESRSARIVLRDAVLADDVVHSDGIDGFCGSRLEGVLHARGMRRLVLAGVGLETCVHSTMRSANDRGFECLLVRDAVAAYEPHLAPASVSMIEMSGGIFGAVARTADVTSAFCDLKGD